MAKRFKGKRKFSYTKTLKFILIIFIVFIIYQIFEFIFLSIKLTNSNETFINYILEDTNYYSYYEKKNKNIIYKVINALSDKTINSPINLLESNFKYKSNQDNTTKVVTLVTKEHINNDLPLVYIYNSHQTESYNIKYLEEYNITPNVLMAAHIFQEKLNNINIKTEVLNENISDYLKNNNMNYSKSYEASRHFIEPIITNNNSVILYIDLHRDAASYNVSTTTINNKNCAKIMFVVGQEYSTYETNLSLANTLNEKIKANYPTLSRGVLLKSGKGVNGVYNQDLSSNMILLELGGNENNIEEITNTIDLLVPIIGEYINEKR